MDDGLSAADDAALIDAFNLACARYPRGWDAAVPVEGVDAVVDVDTKSVQTPDGGSAVAVYTVTLDRSQDWLITEVGDPTGAIPGGLGEAAPDSGAQESAPAPSPAPGG